MIGFWMAAAMAGGGEPRIVNGTEEEGFPSTVSLAAGPIHVCSGSLITPRIVLSAAHCASDLPIDAITQFARVNVGQTLADPEHSLTLEDAVFHPDYVPLSGSDTGAFDLAVAILEYEAPVVPIPFRTRAFTDDDIGTIVQSVGFGIDETGGGAGIKRSAPLMVSDIDESFLLSDSSDNEQGANICSGDSGGPQYARVNGRYEQWAVHSWGDIDCRFTSGSTRTDIAADWILDQVERVHGTRDICLAAGRYEDGWCDESCPKPDPDCSPYVLGPGEGVAAPVGCNVSVNSFCSPFVLFTLLALSRRRSV
jgi:V8-like Glu-specific endopeptidase